MGGKLVTGPQKAKSLGVLCAVRRPGWEFASPHLGKAEGTEAAFALRHLDVLPPLPRSQRTPKNSFSCIFLVHPQVCTSQKLI